MELAAFEGLNATIAGDTTVSAAFTLKMRVESPGVLLLWCSNGAEVVVSYAGVALAWGDLPGFCVERSGDMELTVKPWGRGVGLSEELRRRLDTEWRAGTAQMLVHVKLFYSRSLSPADDIYEGQPTKHLDVDEIKHPYMNCNRLIWLTEGKTPTAFQIDSRAKVNPMKITQSSLSSLGARKWERITYLNLTLVREGFVWDAAPNQRVTASVYQEVEKARRV
ncbi:hypothetical protein EJB05_55614, partial [Eragrostis curvula]